MINQLYLMQNQVQAIMEYAANHAPLEACGLLAGKQERVEEVLFVENQARSPVRFVMDPYEQLRAFDRIESRGLELLGIFHSHPAGPETVSTTDIAEAAYPVVHVICSLSDRNWRLRGFWIANGKSNEVTLRVIE